MNDMTVDAREFFDKGRQFSSDDLPKIKKIVGEVVKDQQASDEEVAVNYFQMEAEDYTLLNNPEDYIFSNRSYILFVQFKFKMVVICALVNVGFTLKEIAISSFLKLK